MHILFNGKQRELKTGTSIQDLLDQLRLDCLQVVVELNHDIVTRQRFAETVLSDGDTLEVIHFVGGG